MAGTPLSPQKHYVSNATRKDRKRGTYPRSFESASPLGSYQSFDLGARYQVKRIVVKQRGRLSLQLHHHRAEHWVVVRGTARVTIGDKAQTLHENESIYVPIGARHRLENPGKIDLELIEVQTGSDVGEDDIERIEDDYHR
jgi:mannose-6-phosphate isomerase-like protein (cupin superfamily)